MSSAPYGSTQFLDSLMGPSASSTSWWSSTAPADPWHESDRLKARYAPTPALQDEERRKAEMERLLRMYPQVAAGLQDPDVARILRQAANEGGWDDIKLYGALITTKWWKTTSDLARTFDALAIEDPATAARMAAQQAAALQNRSRELGLGLSQQEIGNLAWASARHGWTEAEQVDRMLKTVDWAKLEPGNLEYFKNRAIQIGAQYLTTVSESTAQGYAMRMASGEMTEAGVASAMARQAKIRFSWMSDDIDQGVTPSQYLEPVRMKIAEELELPISDVNLMDSKWLSMVERQDEASGKMRSATLYEATMAARRDPAWVKTQNANTAISEASGFLRSAFGMRAI